MPPRYVHRQEADEAGRPHAGQRADVAQAPGVVGLARHDCAVLRLGSAVRSVNTPSALNPGSIACTVSNARISRPAETSSTTDAIISTDDERRRALLLTAARSSASRRPSRSGVAADAHRRRQAEGDAGEHRQPDATRSTRRSTDGVLGDRQRRRDEPQQRHARRREFPRIRRAREQQALGHQLPDEPFAAGANRRPDRQLAAAAEARASSRFARLAHAISSTQPARRQRERASRDRWETSCPSGTRGHPCPCSQRGTASRDRAAITAGRPAPARG